MIMGRGRGPWGGGGGGLKKKCCFFAPTPAPTHYRSHKLMGIAKDTTNALL